MKRLTVLLLALLAAPALRAEFLFAPVSPTDNGFFTPTMSYIAGEYEYSAWDIFYAPSGAGNYPDIFAPAGGVWDEETQTWKPEPRSAAGFPTNPRYNPADPYAFWDEYNATITQTRSTTAFIIGPDISGNIYTFQDKTAYRLHNHPDYDQLGSVIFQFQTDGTNVDFSKIRLGYRGLDGNIYYLGVDALETEYLREYSTTGSDHWSATAGYRNRVLFQWDLSGISGTGEFWIEWESLSSSMSFQKADLVTSSYYEVAMPVSSTWVGGHGVWDDASNWTGQAGSVPLENGNLKFKNTSAASVEINDASHLVGEIIFENADNVTISSVDGHRLIANTGITTRSTAPDAASRVYTFDADYEFGALNFFEINTGTVVMNGRISGNYGMVKLGAGTLELNGDNTFTGFLAVQDGTLRLAGSNSYTGSTTVVNGRLIVAHDQAFGTGTSPITVGGDQGLYAYTTGAASWMAELLIEGDRTVSRDIALAPGDLGKRLGAYGTNTGATFSGDISFSGNPADPDSTTGASAVGNVSLTAQASTDVVTFSGSMTGGASTKTVTIDGQGTVVYAGVDKTYNNATAVAAGTLLIAEDTALRGGGAVTVASGARLRVEGRLANTGNITVSGGRLEVDGTIESGGLLTLSNAHITGSGDINRAFTVANGTIIDPGTGVGSLQTDSQTWGAGGSYLWEISSLATGAGAGWDLLAISGDLTFSTGSGTPFEITLTSLDGTGAAGLLAGFDEMADYSWVIASATGSINNFGSFNYLLDASGFANAYTGQFGLSVIGDDLVLTYTAVPEPSALLLLAAAAAVFFFLRRRAQFAAASPQCEDSATARIRR